MNRGPAKQIRAQKSSALISGDCVIPLAFSMALLMKVIFATMSDRSLIRSTRARVGLVQRGGVMAPRDVPRAPPGGGVGGGAAVLRWNLSSALLHRVHRSAEILP